MSRRPIKFASGLNYVICKDDGTCVPENAPLYNNNVPIGTLEELKYFTDYGNDIIKNSAGELGTSTELNEGKLTAIIPNNNTIPQGGKRKSRRNTKRKKSRKGKSRKNIRKSNRRR